MSTSPSNKKSGVAALGGAKARARPARVTINTGPRISQLIRAVLQEPNFETCLRGQKTRIKNRICGALSASWGQTIRPELMAQVMFRQIAEARSTGFKSTTKLGADVDTMQLLKQFHEEVEAHYTAKRTHAAKLTAEKERKRERLREAQLLAANKKKKKAAKQRERGSGSDGIADLVKMCMPSAEERAQKAQLAQQQTAMQIRMLEMFERMVNNNAKKGN